MTSFRDYDDRPYKYTNAETRMTIENLQNMAILKSENLTPASEKLLGLFNDILEHDGFGEIRVEVNILKRKQKEVILHCGKQYRFVVDTPQQA